MPFCKQSPIMQHHIIDAQICPDQYWVGDFAASVDVQDFLSAIEIRVLKTPKVNNTKQKEKTCPAQN